MSNLLNGVPIPEHLTSLIQANLSATKEAKGPVVDLLSHLPSKETSSRTLLESPVVTQPFKVTPEEDVTIQLSATLADTSLLDVSKTMEIANAITSGVGELQGPEMMPPPDETPAPPNAPNYPADGYFTEAFNAKYRSEKPNSTAAIKKKRPHRAKPSQYVASISTPLPVAGSVSQVIPPGDSIPPPDLLSLAPLPVEPLVPASLDFGSLLDEGLTDTLSWPLSPSYEMCPPDLTEASDDFINSLLAMDTGDTSLF
jgi:hypothetical protein